MNFSKLWETVEDREAWHAVVHGVTKSWTWLSDWTTATKTLDKSGKIFLSILRLFEVDFIFISGVFSSVQSLSHVRLFVTPWIAAHQASLSITNSRSSLKLTSIESVMPSGHLILCHPLFLLPPIPPSIRVFSNESTLPMRWPKY